MPPTRRRLLRAGAGLVLGGISPLHAASQLKLVVVVGSGSPVRDLEPELLRALFLGDPVEGPGGIRLVGWNDPPSTPIRRLFDRLVLHMDEEQVGRHWVDRRIRGQGSAPRSIPGASVRQRLLAKFPQCVTYVASHELDPTVRAVRVGGRAWSDPGYPLVG